MKHVFSNWREIAHLWANQTQDQAYTPTRHCSFKGKELYSYRATIGRLHPEVKAVLFSSDYEHYSMTTSKQMWHARQAVSTTNYPNRFLVPRIHVRPFPKRSVRGVAPGTEYGHTDNLNYFVSHYVSNMAQAAKARTKKAYYEAVANRYITSAEEYCAVFNVPKSISNKIIKSDVLARVRVQRARDDKLLAAETKKAMAAHIVAEAKRREDQAKLDGMTVEQRVTAWRALAYDDRVLPRDGVVRLRIWPTKQLVLTSSGANIPLDHARRVWPILCRAKRNGTHITKDMGGGLHFGVYQSFESFNKDQTGELVVGCHAIPWVEIADIAERLALVCPEAESA